MLHYKIEQLRPANAPPKEQRQLSRKLLQQLLSEHCGIDTLPEIGVRFGGKPYFPQHPDIHFNLSHCNSAVLAAISDKNVGCDIEDIMSEEGLDILHIVFSSIDTKIILASPNPSLEMTRLWTRKEALVKHNGNIPDDPINWPSSPENIDDSKSLLLITEHAEGCPYVFSIAFTS